MFRYCIAVSKEPKDHIAENIILKLKQKTSDPNFILLFSTIHYKKIIKEILNKIKKEFSNSNIIGGTVTGFISKEDVFTKGLVALSVEYENMEVSSGFGKNVKRDPKHAAEQCSKKIRFKIKNKYRNKVIINIISSPTIPKLPLIGKVNVVHSNIFGKIASKLISFFSFFGYGIGKEVEVIETLSSLFPNFKIIGGSSVDDGKMLTNLQFFNNKVLENSIVALKIETDLKIEIIENIGEYKEFKTFTITDLTHDNYVIKKIENIPAKEYLLKILDIKEKEFSSSEFFYYKFSDFFPITFRENRKRVIGVGGFFGNNIILSHKAGGKNAILLSISGNKIINNIKKSISNVIHDPILTLIFSSAIFMFILGKDIYKIKQLLDKKFNDYLVLFPMVENVKISKNVETHVYSFNMLNFGEKHG